MLREERAALDDGFALLAGSAELWDMEFPTGGQVAANALFERAEANAAS